MVSGIVQHQHHARVAGAMSQQRLQKGLERGRVERGAPRADDRAGAQTDGPTIGDRLAGGRMEEDRILDRGRHPHAAPGAMLLEVAFVHAPEFNAPTPGRRYSFFKRRDLVRVGLGDLRLGLAQPESHGAEEAVALAPPVAQAQIALASSLPSHR